MLVMLLNAEGNVGLAVATIFAPTNGLMPRLIMVSRTADKILMNAAMTRLAFASWREH